MRRLITTLASVWAFAAQAEQPLTLASSVVVDHAWVSAADVVQGVAQLPRATQASLAQLRLARLSGCAPLALPAEQVARQMARQWPGRFSITMAGPAPAHIQVRSVGQVLGGQDLAEQLTGPRWAECAGTQSCQVQLVGRIDPVCVPPGPWQVRGQMLGDWQAGQPGPARLQVLMDGQSVATMQVQVALHISQPALQLQRAVGQGQAIRRSDVLAVVAPQRATAVVHYDSASRLVRAGTDLPAGALLPPALMALLAQGRADDEIQIEAQVGVVRVAREARLASDAKGSGQALATVGGGQVLQVRRAGDGPWEMVQ